MKHWYRAVFRSVSVNPKVTFAFQIKEIAIRSEVSMADSGHIKRSIGTETFYIWRRLEGIVKEGSRGGLHRESGRIKAEDGGRVLSPAVQLR